MQRAASSAVPKNDKVLFIDAPKEGAASRRYQRCYTPVYAPFLRRISAPKVSNPSKHPLSRASRAQEEVVRPQSDRSNADAHLFEMSGDVERKGLWSEASAEGRTKGSCREGRAEGEGSEKNDLPKGR